MNEKQQLDDEVTKVEQEYIAASKQFTAMDIGNELKKRGINARQREISPIVREHFENGNMYITSEYTRTLIDVNNNKAKAFLYFNIQSDPGTYQETTQSPIPWQAGKPIFPHSLGSIDDTVLDNQLLTISGPKTIDDITIPITSASTLEKYIASNLSRVMHTEGCRYVSKIKPGNKLTFYTSDPIAQSYRPCKCER